MAIKVTVGEQKTQNELPFPKLMKLKDDGSIIYFLRKGVGIPLYDKVGMWSDDKISLTDWNMRCFEDYNETITLQNETT